MDREIFFTIQGAGIALLMLALYVAPTLQAFRRRHPRRVAIALVNVLLGWTLAGWVAAAIWSDSTREKRR